jgi:hypothetical protein
MANHDDVFEQARLKLVGRIYPAIKSCVSNRYRILLGIFAFYSFIATTDLYEGKPVKPWIFMGVSAIFTVFIVHNMLNYRKNAQEQYAAEDVVITDKRLKSKSEKKKKKEDDFRHGIKFEIVFGVCTFLIVVGLAVVFVLID